MPAQIASLPVTFRVEHNHVFDGGTIEVRRYVWSRLVEQDVQGIADALVLDMALSSRPAMTRVDRIEAYCLPTDGNAGRLLIMMPRAAYHISAPCGAFRSLNCTLDCAHFERVLGEPIDWAALSDLGGELRPGTEIERLLTRMHDEVTTERIGRAAVIEACAATLRIELLRRFRQGRPARPDVYTGGLAAWRMRLLIDRVHADLPAPSVGELAALCDLTTRQLGRAFKAETGVTVGRYVLEATMERAHRMLTCSNLMIAQIARELGFASADSFAQSYRRITGRSPSRARRN